VGTTDLHCHILPGVDDGPATMDESVAYAAAIAASGTRTVVATPHVELVDVHEVPDRVRELRDALATEGIELEVRCGGEIKPFSVAGLSAEELELLAHGPRGARWVLYEVPFSGIDEEFAEGADELRRRGYGLLLAHPERARGMLDEGLRALEAQLREGALVAANVGPLLGREGPDRTLTAEQLLRRGVPHVVATDAHPPRRPYTLQMGAEAVERITGRADHARRLTADAPAQLLADGIAAGRRAA
jgi:protein-tyrosine phosphatase